TRSTSRSRAPRSPSKWTAGRFTLTRKRSSTTADVRTTSRCAAGRCCGSPGWTSSSTRTGFSPSSAQRFRCASGRSAHGNTPKSLGEAVLQSVELIFDAGGQLLADELEPLLDQRDLLAPLLGVHRQRGVDVVSVDVEPLEVEVLGGGHDADRRGLAVRLALDALDDPLEHPAVLAEARPQKAAVLAATEPVDEEHLRHLRL